ncbi:MAG TPA: hypothetical protein VJO33_05340 [Gemmatimonadaceae bacterium]|nr:hypothetical protein [Gemmatimonadaceae bacterium]
MRISETTSRLVVRDTPHGLWSLGLVFVMTGAFVLSTPFWSADWRSFGPWERLAMIAIGLGHFAGGLFTTLSPRATQTELDQAAGTVTLRVRRFWPFTGVTARFPLAEARAIEIVRSTDNDNDPMFQLRLWLAESRKFWLQAQPVYGEARAIDEAERLRRFLGLGNLSAP